MRGEKWARSRGSVVLLVVLELLGGDGGAEEELEGGQDVVAGRSEARGLGEHRVSGKNVEAGHCSRGVSCFFGCVLKGVVALSSLFSGGKGEQVSACV